jgi:hypothetical protein
MGDSEEMTFHGHGRDKFMSSSLIADNSACGCGDPCRIQVPTLDLLDGHDDDPFCLYELGAPFHS